LIWLHLALNTDRLPDWQVTARLWLVLDHIAAAPRSPAEVTELCLAGGVDAVLCRLRGIPYRRQLELAAPAREICKRHGVPLIVSHDLKLALDLQADGVQFGIADGEITELREQTAGRMPFGFSSHATWEAQYALREGADWVFLGPVFASTEKLQYGAPLGLEIVKRALQLNQAERIVFIGGINQQTLPALAEVGGRRIASIGALQHCLDPTKTARMLRQTLSE
jgi:thiamine-phosphate pyrophosphorylase